MYIYIYIERERDREIVSYKLCCYGIACDIMYQTLTEFRTPAGCTGVSPIPTALEREEAKPSILTQISDRADDYDDTEC